MVSLSVVKDSSYFTEIKHQSGHGTEYFSEQGQALGNWQGKLAEKEGLVDKPVTEQDIQRLTEGYDRVGLNITYSAPKSVSLAHSLLGDTRIKDIHEQAVRTANEWLEQNLAQTRQGQGGAEKVGVSGVAIANFTHYTSRENDPQLHTHSVVLNCVERATDGHITALEPQKIFQYQKALDQVYKTELARGLQELGYRVEMTDQHGNFEIVGFDEKVLQAFSTRSQQVQETAERLKNEGKITTENEYALRDVAAIESRAGKLFMSREELQRIWDQKLREIGITRDDLFQQVRQVSETLKQSAETRLKFTETKAEEYVRQASRIIHENESAFTKEKLTEIALRQSLSNATKGEKVMGVGELEKAIQRLEERGEILKVKGTDFLTTRDMKQTEKGIIEYVKKTNGTESAFADKDKIREAINKYESTKGIQMTGDQRKAVEHILGSRDKVIGIQGDAGVGKTTSFELVKEFLEKQGYVVRGLAPTGKAAEELGKVGIKSQTVDSFLNMAKNTSVVSNIKEYTKEYERLNQKFENRSWATPPAMLSKTETWESQIKNYVLGSQTGGREGMYEYKDKAFLLERDGWKGKMIVEQGNRWGYPEINVYIKDEQTGRIMHSMYTPIGGGVNIKEYTRTYEAPDKVFQSGKEVWIVDETSMLGSNKMASILKEADKFGARVILAGDIKQLRSVEQGKIFEDLQSKRVLNTVEMKEKVRQKDEQYREIVKSFSEKNFVEAISKLEKSGNVKEIHDKAERMQAIKEDYLKGEYTRTHIVVSTNKEKNILNSNIRDALKERNKVDAKGYIFSVRESKNLGAEEKRYSFSYTVGDSVHIARKDMKEMKITSKKNEFIIKGVDHKANTITITDGKKDFQVNLSRDGDKLSVYSQKQIELSKGDKVMTLKNDKKLGIKNGEMWIVKEIKSDGEITLRNENKEKTINIKEYNYIDHGYTSTVHKAQGMTVEKVIFSCDNRTNYNEMYTALTRGKIEYKLYTNSKEEMYNTIKHEQEKTSSLDKGQEKTSSLNKGRTDDRSLQR